MDPYSKNVKSCSGNLSKSGQPFYEPPPCIQKTSAEIINEARAAIREAMPQHENTSYPTTSVKPLTTNRPFTPRDKQRTLFGKKSSSTRPPSSFSLRYLQFENPENTVVEAKSSREDKYKVNRSNSIADINNDRIFSLKVKDFTGFRKKLPSLDGPLKGKKKLSQLSYLSEEIETEYNDLHADIKRNAFSSPKERTDFDSNFSSIESPFSYPSNLKHRNSEGLILGPRNLDKIFENKQIIQDSEKLFVKKNLWASVLLSTIN